MSVMTRRSSTRKTEKEEMKHEIVEEEPEDDDDEDLPPPVLEREESCGENEDTDGDAKEEEDTTTPPLQRESPKEPEEEDVEDEESKEKQINLMEALASVFNADDNKKKKSNGDFKLGGSRQFPPLKQVVMGRGPGRPLGSTNANSSLRLAKLSHPLSSTPSTSGSQRLDGRRNYGHPPPIPHALRPLITGVGSNTSPGPGRILENRKRSMNDKDAVVAKRPSLVAYNGGRAGEKFRASTSSAIDMLRDQSPVRIQVSAGGASDESDLQDALELAAQQKETIGQVARGASNHSLLLGSMVINGLNTLQDRNSDDYQNFASELYSLIAKYRIH